jgi:carboxypeptidase Q
LSGSSNLNNAIQWVVEQLHSDGTLRNIEQQPVMVPNWRRNNESLSLLEPIARPSMPFLGLGGSVATPLDGITADVVVVSV